MRMAKNKNLTNRSNPEMVDMINSDLSLEVDEEILLDFYKS